jgi:hypothetical protein
MCLGCSRNPTHGLLFSCSLLRICQLRLGHLWVSAGSCEVHAAVPGRSALTAASCQRACMTPRCGLASLQGRAAGAVRALPGAQQQRNARRRGAARADARRHPTGGRFLLRRLFVLRPPYSRPLERPGAMALQPSLQTASAPCADSGPREKHSPATSQRKLDA